MPCSCQQHSKYIVAHLSARMWLRDFVQPRRVGLLLQHVIAIRQAPTLSFVGLPWQDIPFPLIELQSKWIARVLSGCTNLPSR